jgi:prophage regulatory protein
MSQQSRRFLRLPDVKHQVGLGRTAIYQKIKAGEFPAPIPLSNNGRAVGWDSEAINAWIESRIQAAGVAK